MAARTEAFLPELVQLPHLRPTDLDGLLAEEIEVWQRRFAWDFRPSADLLRRFLQIRSLYGFALREGQDFVGYAYYVCEGRKGVIGDFYVRSAYASPSREMYLLGAVIQGLLQTSGIRRIESQLMLLRTPPSAGPMPFAQNVARHERYFMEIDRDSVLKLIPVSPSHRVSFVPWSGRYGEEMAQVVTASYRGNVDAEINDQYRSIPGSRQFLNNIVRFPGCGRFSADASTLALDASTGKVCGMCLASQVSTNAGHVTQLCVLPALRGTRLGYELLRQTLRRLSDLGCTSMSLTVTCVNTGAVRLYRSAGFHAEATFPALVWEGF